MSGSEHAVTSLTVVAYSAPSAALIGFGTSVASCHSGLSVIGRFGRFLTSVWRQAATIWEKAAGRRRREQPPTP